MSFGKGASSSYVTRRNMSTSKMSKRPERKPRGRFHHGNLRAAAVELAVAEVEKSGYAALTLELIGKKLGVTRPALYRHFADCRALLFEVAQNGYERFEVAQTEAF